MAPPDEPLRERLLEVAEQSICHGLLQGHPLPVHPPDEPEPLREPGASFVTLKRNGALRGCIGTIEPLRPLVDDVAHNAYAAAFRDPRFLPLAERELTGLELQISLLGRPEPLVFSTEEELLSQIRPGMDGLILHDGGHRGTLLPVVWESVPDAREFLRQLKIKAGLPPDWWSGTLNVARFTTESFGTRL